MAIPYKAVASGVLTFGMAAIPVKVLKGTESIDRDTQIKQIHAGTCGGEVGRHNYCKKCSAQLEAENIGKAVQGVAFDEAILDTFKVESDKAIVVETFVPLNSIDRRLFDEPRYIVPDKAGHGPLRAFADTMLDRAEPVAAIAKMAERETEKVVAIYAIAPQQGKPAVLVAGVLRRPEAIRDASVLSAEMESGAAPSEPVKKMVNSLIDAMLEPFLDPSKYADKKAEARTKALREIAAGGKPTPTALAEPKATPELDLLAALTASVAAKGGTKATEAKSKAKKK